MTQHPEDDVFTGTQVGAVLESLRHDMFLMAERLDTVCEDITVMKADIRELKTDMTTVKDVIRLTIPDIASRLTRLETKAGI